MRLTLADLIAADHAATADLRGKAEAAAAANKAEWEASDARDAAAARVGGALLALGGRAIDPAGPTLLVADLDGKGYTAEPLPGTDSPVGDDEGPAEGGPVS